MLSRTVFSLRCIHRRKWCLVYEDKSGRIPCFWSGRRKMDQERQKREGNRRKIRIILFSELSTKIILGGIGHHCLTFQGVKQNGDWEKGCLTGWLEDHWWHFGIESHLSCSKKRHLRGSVQRRGGSKRKLVCLERNRTVIEGSTFFKQEEACVWLMTGEKGTVGSRCCRSDNRAQ